MTSLSAEAYKEKALALVLKHLEGGTRFGAADAKVVAANVAYAEVVLRGVYTLTVKSTRYDAAGGPRPTGTDAVVTADAQFEAVHKAIVDELLRSESRFEKLNQLLTRDGYRAYPHGTKTTFAHSSREVLMEKTCYSCGGMGENSCTSCGGHGQSSCYGCGGCGHSSCYTCGGSGRDSCGHCGGSGQLCQANTVYDHDGTCRTETTFVSCSFCCGGSNTCSGCGGSGSQTCGSCGGSGTLTCGSCSGRGKTTCDHCDGHGDLTQTGGASVELNSSFTYGIAESTPDWAVAYIKPYPGHAKLTEIGRVTTESIVVGPPTQGGVGRYKGLVPYAEITLHIRDTAFTLKVIGKNPGLYDADNVLRDMLLPDLACLRAASAGWRKLTPLYYRHAEKAIRPFLESEVNQALVAELCRGKQPQAIVGVLNRTVDEPYVIAADEALRAITDCATRWSKMTWAALITMAAYPGVLMFFWLREMLTASHTMLTTAAELPVLGVSSFEDQALITGAVLATAYAASRAGRWSWPRWAHRAGGPPLTSFMGRRQLSLGRAPFVTGAVVGLIASFYLVATYPLWLNQKGDVQGQFAVGIPAPRLEEPPKPKPAPRPKAKAKSAKQAKPKPKHTEEPALDSATP